MAEKVIPIHMIPDATSKTIELKGKRYLQTNEAMFTFYKRTKGEFSEYFLRLKEDKVLLGARCPVCKLVRVPPFMRYCPECDFAAMEMIEMPDTGVLNSTPPITYFGNALFQHEVPFGRGRVFLDGADTALPILVYTTRGVLTPTVFKKGTQVKIIFKDERFGKPTDIFAVPLDEVPSEKRGARGLQESDLDWKSPVEPPLRPSDESRKAVFESLILRFSEMAVEIAASDRARKDLADWTRNIQVKTPEGAFSLMLRDQTMAVSPGILDHPDLVMVADDPAIFMDWMDFKDSLTNAIIAGKLWISQNKDFVTVFRLDRLPRSIKRTKE
jgi:uncharacterized OB-fold protein